MTQNLPANTSTWQTELKQTAFKNHLLIVKIGLILNLVFAANDYLNSPTYFIDFLNLRVTVSTLMLLIVVFKNKFIEYPELIVLIPVIAITIENAFMYSLLEGDEFKKHTIAYIALFLASGMFIIWQRIYSYIFVIISIIVNIVFFNLNSQLPINEILINGGLLTLTIALLSCLQIELRSNLTKKEIEARLELAKNNHKLSLQNEIIEKKNKDIKDSLDYAKTIQEATLPIIELKQKLFSDSFILFKPKDIVSGDFYWFAEKDGKRIIAACDCTGHGVPGALMSMIGMNILNHIVNEKGLTAPNEILNNLHIEVRKALKQDTRFNAKDGMDIAVVTFYSETDIEFAGARRPLWVISKNNNPTATTIEIKEEKEKNSLNSSITEIKGDKFAIGGIQNEVERKFTTHKLSVNKGDCIYIFSDGFADQFSELYEKLMISRFKELVISIQSKPIEDQKTFLNNYIKRWQGTHVQIDDILVIGIRV
jgi:serine phosphatase RsbU (regulator of sigma subunit)